MRYVFGGWCLLACLVGLAWLIRYIVLGNMARRRKLLSADSEGAYPDPPPRVSILVAAKDEEANIQACVESLLDQDYPNFELIVINDRSSDRTGAILADLEQKARGALRVVTVRDLTDGWFGKNNAMNEGVKVASGEWLCFMDADCRQTSRRTISVAVSEAIAHRIDFLSLTPILDTRRTWERIIQPVCAAILIARFRPSRVNRADNTVAYANGQFMLLNRKCYDGIGGHERVRNRINEDMHLARNTKAGGFKLRVLENDGLYVTRMYATFDEAWRGWTRIFYGCFESIPTLCAVALVTFVCGVAPWLSVVAACTGLVATLGTASAGRWAVAALLWAVAVGLLLVANARLYHGFLRFDRRWAWTYGLGCCIAVGMLISAMLKTIGITSTTWRGTTYRGKSVEESVRDV